MFVITKYKGPDPEVRYSENSQLTASGLDLAYVAHNNVLAPGLDDLLTWPATRSFSIGVNLVLQ